MERAIPTSISAEMAEQARWQLRPQYAGIDWFTQLIPNEFSAEPERDARLVRALKTLLSLAGDTVPHYQELFRARGFAPERLTAVADLDRLPILGKAELVANPETFRALRQPSGNPVVVDTSSSGTTGRPVRVYQALSWVSANHLMYQRQYRWFRYDPRYVFASIRAAAQLPPAADGQPLAPGRTGRYAVWPRIGSYFETGPYLTFSLANGVEERLAWLAEHAVDYLVAYSDSLEYLAIAGGGQPRHQLRGVTAISEVLTPHMRTLVEAGLCTRVNQNYGLNEAGLVASKCPEGNRYHVHIEHCLVEIVDAGGSPCAHGETGRILVTVLTNPAMPLIRYDTDDLAVCLRDPCPCGRTLPSFGEVIGRYSRVAFLPPGTMARVGALREALATAPLPWLRNLTRYRIHQYRDGGVELRLQACGPLPDALIERLAAAWPADPPPPMPLTIRQVGDIPVAPGGKHQDFTSEHFPPIAGPADSA